MSPMMRIIPAALLLPAPALGQPPNVTSGRAPTVYEITLPGSSAWVRVDTVSTWVMAPGDPRTVFNAAVKVFKDLKIPTEVLDSTRSQVGTLKLVQSRTFAGNRMSLWLGCGQGLTGPNADSWRIYMALVSGVEAASADSSRIRTLLTATARNMGGNSSNPVPCSSTGQFELMLGKRILKELTKGDS